MTDGTVIDLSLPFDLEAPDLASFEDKSQAKRFSSLTSVGHWGTHLDRLLGTKVPPAYFKSRGLCLDVRHLVPSGAMAKEDIDLGLIRKGDFVIFRTGVMESHPYGSEGYLKARFDVGWDLLEALLGIGVRFLGLDARGLRADSEHAKADTTCERAGVYVIENLTSLAALPAGRPMTVYAAIFDFGGTGLPAKVFAEP
ncbi:MAG: cyclase family protein [Deltaproteobacteria bacterium]|jgi:kynurenine formamidase|nr:cyclase family protein [Deltaproteobacteria bacterium]